MTCAKPQPNLYQPLTASHFQLNSGQALCKIFVVMVALSILVISSADAGKLYPRDEAGKDHSFQIFRDRLLNAVQNHDQDFLLSIIAPDIMNSFGGDDGKENFVKIWEPDKPDSKIWQTLADILTLGGNFSPDRQEFWAPYVFSAFPDDADAFSYLAIVGENVNVRAQPSLNAPVLTTLSYDLVKRLDNLRLAEETPTGPRRWLKIATPQGRPGYVAAQHARSPLDYRAGFKKINGRWLMAVLVAGD